MGQARGRATALLAEGREAGGTRPVWSPAGIQPCETISLTEPRLPCLGKSVPCIPREGGRHAGHQRGDARWVQVRNQDAALNSRPSVWEVGAAGVEGAGAVGRLPSVVFGEPGAESPGGCLSCGNESHLLASSCVRHATLQRSLPCSWLILTRDAPLPAVHTQLSKFWQILEPGLQSV